MSGTASIIHKRSQKSQALFPFMFVHIVHNRETKSRVLDARKRLLEFRKPAFVQK
jgi:hypothetical protein